MANPEEGDSSASKAVHRLAGRVNVNAKEQTIKGITELIQEGHVSKNQILDNLSGDLKLYRKDIEAINGPAPKPTQTQVSAPDSTFEEPLEEPEPFNPAPAIKKKEKPKTQPTTQTGPKGLADEPVLSVPKLM
jgi:hypothetical protein